VPGAPSFANFAKGGIPKPFLLRAEGLRLDGRSLRMARDRNDGDYRRSFPAFDFIGTVMPEDTVGAGGVVLRIGLEDLLAVDARQRGELVCV